MQRCRLRDEPCYPWYAGPSPICPARVLIIPTDDNKTKIAKSGALVPLTRLARSKDMRVQRNATGALLNMTHSGTCSVFSQEITHKRLSPLDENRQQLVNAGAIPVLVSLLNSQDTDVQYYCTTALSNIAVDGERTSRCMLYIADMVWQGTTGRSLPKQNLNLSQALYPSWRVLVSRYSAKRPLLFATLLAMVRKLLTINVEDEAHVCYSEKYQLEIVKCDGLTSLLRLLQSTYLPLILSAAACVRNVSIHPQNESPIIESGFLEPLINLLAFKDNEEVQCHAISTLRNLAASSEKNKLAIVKAGAVQSIKELVLEVPMNVQSEMTACIAVLALSGTF